MQYTFTTENDFLADTIIGVSRIVENSVLFENEPGMVFTKENAMALLHLLTCVMHTIGDHNPNDHLLPAEIESWLSVANKFGSAADTIRNAVNV